MEQYCQFRGRWIVSNLVKTYEQCRRSEMYHFSDFSVVTAVIPDRS